MKNGLYHIQDNNIYKMSLNEPMEKIGIMVSDESIMNIIDTVTEYMYCNFGNCYMKDNMTWTDLQIVRDEIKNNAMDMIKGNLGLDVKESFTPLYSSLEEEEQEKDNLEL